MDRKEEGGRGRRRGRERNRGKKKKKKKGRIHAGRRWERRQTASGGDSGVERRRRKGSVVSRKEKEERRKKKRKILQFSPIVNTQKFFYNFYRNVSKVLYRYPKNTHPNRAYVLGLCRYS